MKIPVIAFRNLKKNLNRTAFLIMVIAVVSGTLFAVMLLLKSMSSAPNIGTYRFGADIVVVPSEAEAQADLMLSGEPAQFFMDKSKLDYVKKVEGVAKASPQLYIKRESTVSCCTIVNAFLVAFDPGTDFTVKPWIDEHVGHNLGPNEVISGRSLPVQKGDVINLIGSAFSVKGKMDAAGSDVIDRAIFMNLETAYKTAEDSKYKAVLPLSVGRNQISAVLVRTDEKVDPRRVAIRIEHDVPGVKAIAPDIVISTVRKQLTALMRTVSFLGIALWLVVFSILTFVYSSISQEQTLEVSQVLISPDTRLRWAAVNLGESALISTAGGAAGIVAGIGVLKLCNDWILGYLQLPTLFPEKFELLRLMGMSLLFSVMTSLVATIMPALAVYRFRFRSYAKTSPHSVPVGSQIESGRIDIC